MCSKGPKPKTFALLDSIGTKVEILHNATALLPTGHSGVVSTWTKKCTLLCQFGVCKSNLLQSLTSFLMVVHIREKFSDFHVFILEKVCYQNNLCHFCAICSFPKFSKVGFTYSASLKFGYSEKATKLEKIFHLKFDATE